MSSKMVKTNLKFTIIKKKINTAKPQNMRRKAQNFPTPF